MSKKAFTKTTTLSIFVILLTITAMFSPFLVNAITWSDPERLTDHTRFEGLPAVAQARDGKIWVVWESDTTGNPEIVAKAYNGTTWSTEKKLTSSSSQDISPTIFVAQDSTIWLFWSTNRMGNFDIYCKTSSDNGTSWSGKTQLTTNPNNDHVPSAMQSSDGIIWLFWQRKLGTNDELFYRTSNDGVFWSGEQQFTTDPNRDKFPSIMQARDGKIWLVWSSNKEGDFDLFYKTYDGFLWSPEETRLTTSPNLDSDPSITQAVNGTIYLFWTSREPSQTAQDCLYYMTSSDDGAMWSSWNLFASASNYDNMWSSVASMDDGRLWVVFTSNRNDNFDIFYKTSSVIVYHDLEMKNVVALPTLVYEGNTIQINVTVKNAGTVNETFDVTAYYDSIEIQTQTVSNLTPKSTKIVTFNWNTQNALLGIHVISATAVPVVGETDTADNSMTDGVVTIKLVGDVDDDGDVDIDDLALIARALGTDPTWPHGTGWDQWNPDCDINNDNKVDSYDLFDAAINYGRTSG